MCVTFAFVAQRSIQKPYFGLEHEKLWLKSLYMQKGNRWYFDKINRVTQGKPIMETLWLLKLSHAVRSGKQYMPISFHPREKCSCCMCTCMYVSPILFIVEICAVFLFIFTSSLTSMLHVQIVVSLHLLLVRIEVFLYVSHFGWTSYTTHDIFTLMLFIFLCKTYTSTHRET